MRTWFPVHEVRTRDTHADRQSRTNALCDRDDVRLHVVMIAGKHLARASHPRLDLIDDQQDPVLIANASQPGKESLRSRHVTTCALHCLDDDSRNFFRRSGGLKEAFLDPVQRPRPRATITAVSRVKWIAKLVWIR